MPAVGLVHGEDQVVLEPDGIHGKADHTTAAGHVTGGNDGIGYSTSRLAMRPSRYWSDPGKEKNCEPLSSGGVQPSREVSVIRISTSRVRLSLARQRSKPSGSLPKVPNQASAKRPSTAHGWTETLGGKHVIKMEKPGHRPITLPYDTGRGYCPGLRAAILREAGLAGHG